MKRTQQALAYRALAYRALAFGMSFLVAMFVTDYRLQAQDWPMWRYDAQRTAAASNNRLPKTLRPSWQLDFGSREQAWDDPLNHDLMTFDRIFEPIVMGGRMFVGFNDQCKVIALDADSGESLWTCYTEAPVRLPPVGWNDRVFFTSDDGFLYCVDAKSGAVNWKFSGAPSNQKVIGNRRLASAWPARGGPVVRDDTVYFASSIWPFMGTFIHALDAETGEVRWVNDSTGAQYIKQPHSAPSFAGVAPQGALIATDDLLLVPGGRSVPAAFNRADGEFRYFEINAGGKGTGGSFVAADNSYFYVHTRQKGTRQFDLEKGVKTAFRPNEPVLNGGKIYSAESSDDKAVVRCYDSKGEQVWEVDADGSGDLILAGNELIAAGGGSIKRMDLSGKISDTITVEGQIERLLCADEKLFAVTLDGRFLTFADPGNGSSESIEVSKNLESSTRQSKLSASSAAKKLLEAGDAEGYALYYGNSNSDTALGIASISPFVQLALVDPNAESVEASRNKLDGEDLYGKITVHHSQPGDFKAPKYIANMIFVDAELVASNVELVAELYQSIRPFGGSMQLIGMPNAYDFAKRIDELKLEQADITLDDNSIIIRRVGALPGAADWTHQYGNIANTVKSDDQRVKLPLGVLWFGGSSNMDVLPRHGHGPPEQVIGGRLFIQGMNSLSARDVYTGRVLWKREFEDLGTFDVYYDKTFTNEPLNPKYNQVHIPGANGRGTNYIVTEDRIYMLEENTCHVLDPATGKTIQDFRLPASDGQEVEWGYIGVYEDVLIGGIGFAKYRKRHDLSFDSDKKLRSSRAGFGTKSFDRAASHALVGMDRQTGEVLWKLDAKNSFWHNGIVAGGNQIYCLDRYPTKIEEALRRRGRSGSENYRILAIDYRTGEKTWEVTEGIFGTWLGYSQEYDLLLQAGAAASDRLYGEPPKGMAVYRARDGSLKWQDMDRRYSGPCILHNDLIITNTNSYSHSAGAFYLLDGKQKLVPNPVTGEMQPWKLTRAYGCNSIIASENMLTFRSGAAGFYDLKSNSGTGNLGGFKSGCTSNLVAAGGVLNAPDYTRTCSCSYQNQTSLALVHMPEADMWSVSSAASVEAVGKRLDRVGLNFGAPGDRRDANGLLWLEYPATAGPSPPLAIKFNKDAEFYQSHTSTKAGTDLPWVRASGVKNITDVSIGVMIQDPKLKEEQNEVREPENYRVRILIGAAKPGESTIVDIYAEDRMVEEGFELSETGSACVLDELPIDEDLELRFVAKRGEPVLQGIELQRN
jgi:outer membrane protein assembly factor BamB